ncbi:MAG: HD domain-containing phosphohydrolase [Ignavibacteria bacterium]
MNQKILFVDDDINILSAYERSLRTNFLITTSNSPKDGIEKIKKAEEIGKPFAVVVSDYRMPEIDGNQFFAAVKQIAPNTVRVMLTGFAEINLAIDAVNEGNVFRFLTKPCSNDKLRSNLNASIEQYRLIVSEKELLDKTLKGSIKVLIDILSISNSVAFSKAGKLRTIAQRLSVNLPPDIQWQIEIAALLSQIGCIAVPTEILEKRINGQTLTIKEKELFLSHPQLGKSLIRNIPRLEEIAEAISYQFNKYVDLNDIDDEKKKERVGIIARILKHANDLHTIMEAQTSKSMSLAAFETRYENESEIGLISELTSLKKNYLSAAVTMNNLKAGMVLRQDIIDKNGLSLVGTGQELSEALIMKLQKLVQLNRIADRVKVYVPKDGVI